MAPDAGRRVVAFVATSSSASRSARRRADGVVRDLARRRPPHRAHDLASSCVRHLPDRRPVRGVGRHRDGRRGRGARQLGRQFGMSERTPREHRPRLGVHRVHPERADVPAHRGQRDRRTTSAARSRRSHGAWARPRGTGDRGLRPAGHPCPTGRIRGPAPGRSPCPGCTSSSGPASVARLPSRSRSRCRRTSRSESCVQGIVFGIVLFTLVVQGSTAELVVRARAPTRRRPRRRPDPARSPLFVARATGRRNPTSGRRGRVGVRIGGWPAGRALGVSCPVAASSSTPPTASSPRRSASPAIGRSTSRPRRAGAS